MRTIYKQILWAFAALFIAGSAYGATINVPAGGDIQAAINGAADGDVIQLAAGTYTLTSTLNVNNDKLTIKGAGIGSTILDITGFTSPSTYAISVTQSEITMEDFSVDGGTSPVWHQHYVFKVSGAGILSDITLKNIEVDGGKRTAFDFNQVDNIILDGLIAKNRTNGVGLALTSCQYATVENITTDNNAWGGIAVYTSNTTGRTSEHITIDGASCSISEPITIFTQPSETMGGIIRNIDVIGYEYTVENDTYRTAADDFIHYREDLADAVNFALNLTNPDDSYIKENPNNGSIVEPDLYNPVDPVVFWVGNNNPFMSIQTAIDHASSGDVINITAGTYEPTTTLVVDVDDLTIKGAGPTTIIDVSAHNGYGIKVPADNATLMDFKVLGEDGGDENQQFLIHVANSNGTPPNAVAIIDQFTVMNLEIMGGYRTGLDLHAVDNFIINGLTVMDREYGNAINLTSCQNGVLSNITSSNNAWGGIGIYTSGGYILEPPANTQNRTAKDISIMGNTCSIGEDSKIYTELTDAGDIIKNINVEGFAYTVENDDFTHPSGNDDQFIFYHITLADAVYYALNLPNPDNSYVKENPNNGSIVEPDLYNPVDPVVFWVGNYNPSMVIQTAVDHASNGDVINITDGTYEEQVVIDGKNITLQGEGPGTIIKSPLSLTDKFVTGTNDNFPIVFVKNTTNVAINDLFVDGAGRGNSNYRFIGVGYYNAGGSLLNLNIENIENTPFSGAQHGVAFYLYNTDGTDRDISVDNCYFEDFQKNAMAISQTSGLVNVNIVNNDIQGKGTITSTAQNGIQLYGTGFTGLVHNNTIDGIAYDGGGWAASSMLMYFPDDNVVCSNNTITNGHACFYLYESNVKILNNSVSVIVASGFGSGIIVADPPNALPNPFDEEIISGKIDKKSGNEIQAGGSPIHHIIDGNTLTFPGGSNSDSYGIEIYGGYVGTNDIYADITNNDISGFEYGILATQLTYTSSEIIEVNIHNNKLHGNDWGVWSDISALVLNAENNWWGTANGPLYDDGTIADGGDGDKVSDYVDFSPYFTDMAMTNLQNIQVDKTSGVKFDGNGTPNLALQNAVTASNHGDIIECAAGQEYTGVTGYTGVTIYGNGSKILSHSPCYWHESDNPAKVFDMEFKMVGYHRFVRVHGAGNLYAYNCDFYIDPGAGHADNGYITDCETVYDYVLDAYHTNFGYSGPPAPGPGAFYFNTPVCAPAAADMVLWHDPVDVSAGDGDNVSQWDDNTTDVDPEDAENSDAGNQPTYQYGLMGGFPGLWFERGNAIVNYDVLEAESQPEITSGQTDIFAPDNTPKNLMVAFMLPGDPGNYYSSNRIEVLFEAGATTSGYSIHLEDGKIIFGMWNRLQRKFIILNTSLETGVVHVAHLEYDGDNNRFRAVLDGASSAHVAFDGLTSDDHNVTGIGAQVQGTRFHNFNVYNDVDYHFEGGIGDIMLYNKYFTPSEMGDIYSFINDRYGLALTYPTPAAPKIAADDWTIFDEDDNAQAGAAQLSPAYPNPFSSVSRIAVNLPESEMVRAELYNSNGELVQLLFEGVLGQGYNEIKIDGETLTPGAYFYRIYGGTFENNGHVILNK